MSHTNLRKTGPITIGSRVMDTISCALIPLSLGAISDCVRHETTNRVILLEGHYPNCSRTNNAPMASSLNT